MALKSQFVKKFPQSHEDVARIVLGVNKVVKSTKYTYFSKLFASVWCSLPEKFKQVFLVNLKNKFKSFDIKTGNSGLLTILSGKIYDANGISREIPNQCFVNNAELTVKEYAEKNILRYFNQNKKKICNNYRAPRSKAVVKSQKFSGRNNCNSNISKTAQVVPKNIKARDPKPQTFEQLSFDEEGIEIVGSSNLKKVSDPRDKVVNQNIKQESVTLEENKNNISQKLETSLNLNNLSDDVEYTKNLQSSLTQISIISNIDPTADFSDDETVELVKINGEYRRK